MKQIRHTQNETEHISLVEWKEQRYKGQFSVGTNDDGTSTSDTEDDCTSIQGTLVQDKCTVINYRNIVDINFT